MIDCTVWASWELYAARYVATVRSSSCAAHACAASSKASIDATLQLRRWSNAKHQPRTCASCLQRRPVKTVHNWPRRGYLKLTPAADFSLAAMDLSSVAKESSVRNVRASK